jgi:hydroxymethylglutaryl-CoA reductase (NADPH)
MDYGRVFGANCEIVIGYVPIPVGIIGPLTLNGQTVYVPMATTEGCLVASTNRGAKAITQGSGAFAVVTRDGITRAPCIRMTTARDAAALKIWCEIPENFVKLKASFESTTSFGKLKSCVPTIAGKNVYIRLTCFSGDAMGMNMVSKGSLAVIETLKNHFPSLQLVALSGNVCTDKKAAAINWIEGRGKSVVVEATIPKDVVRTTLKTSVKGIVETNLQKNLIGSAMACTVGGFNAHASNIVTAVFLATGQDPAQNVESSNCITILEEDQNGDLWISCTMPSLEVGTVGGGTSLPAQASCLDAMGCKGASNGNAPPGSNAQQLAMIIAAATMAGELSLLAALTANTLVSAHMQHNRKPQPVQKEIS